MKTIPVELQEQRTKTTHGGCICAAMARVVVMLIIAFSAGSSSIGA